jgi:hypothetical protein
MCSRYVCSSCVNKEGIRCVRCSSIQKVHQSFLKQNLHFIVLFISLWFFVAGLYPFPYFIAAGIPVDMSQLQPVFIATTVMTIPFIFMLFAWKKRQDRAY